MKKILIALILTVICCNGISKAGVTTKLTKYGAIRSSEPSATGYAVDHNCNGCVSVNYPHTYDGTFDRYYGTNPQRVFGGPRIWEDEDVRVGLPFWGEARGVVEFSLYGVPDEIYVYEPWQDTDNDEPAYTLYLDKIYLRRYWFSGNENSNTSIYGYVGDGYMGRSDIYETDLLIASNVGSYGRIDVTDFVKNLKDDNSYAGFLLKETRNGSLLNYSSFYLDATYIPEPCTISLMAVGALPLMRRRKA